jgi:hypothetical protein
VRHGHLQARPFLTRLLGLGPEGAGEHPPGRHTSAMPGAVRVSAGINTSAEDVVRLLGAVARLATGDPPVRYRRDRQPAISIPPWPVAAPARTQGEGLDPCPVASMGAGRRRCGPAGRAGDVQGFRGRHGRLGQRGPAVDRAARICRRPGWTGLTAGPRGPLGWQQDAGGSQRRLVPPAVARAGKLGYHVTSDDVGAVLVVAFQRAPPRRGHRCGWDQRPYRPAGPPLFLGVRR